MSVHRGAIDPFPPKPRPARQTAVVHEHRRVESHIDVAVVEPPARDEAGARVGERRSFERRCTSPIARPTSPNRLNDNVDPRPTIPSPSPRRCTNSPFTAPTRVERHVGAEPAQPRAAQRQIVDARLLEQRAAPAEEVVAERLERIVARREDRPLPRRVVRDAAVTTRCAAATRVPLSDHVTTRSTRRRARTRASCSCRVGEHARRESRRRASPRIVT